MKKWKQKSIAVLASVGLVLGMQSMVFAQELPQNTVTVNGRGVVTVTPDTATIYLSVEKTDKTAEQAQSAVNKTVQSVITALKELKVAEKDIVTEAVQVSPNYVYAENDKRTQNGYRANTVLEITVHDVEKAGVYVDKALQAGVSRVDDVTFSLSNPEAYYGRALQQAVKTAQNSAQVLANAYGKTLGNVVAVTEQSQNRMFASRADYARGESAGVADGTAKQTEIRYDDVQVEASIVAVYTFAE